jgi:Glu-tRNA(Gln) amidotransferase subunit E-like FAD-binding protein
MAESAIEQAFATLAEAFTITESEIHEEIGLVEQQIEELKERIVQLQEKQVTLAQDREAIEEMYRRYCSDEGNGGAVEF